MITLDHLPLGSQKAGQDLKIRRVPPEISVMAVKNKGIPPRLIINPRCEPFAADVDERCYLRDAKTIRDWFVQYLPHGTVIRLRELLNSQEIK